MDNQKEEQTTEPVTSSIFGLSSFMDEIDDKDEAKASSEANTEKSETTEDDPDAALKKRQQ